MKTYPKRRTYPMAVGLALLAAGLLAGCGDSSGPAGKTPEQIQAETRAGIAANEAKLLTDPVAIKCRAYSGPAYDGERQNLCRHLQMNPRVASVTVETAGGEYDPGLNVLLQPGVSAAQTRTLAHRIKRYMSARYSGDRALIVREIQIHHQASENAEIAALSQATGDHLGMVGAIVQNGVLDSDTEIDPQWHVQIDNTQVE